MELAACPTCGRRVTVAAGDGACPSCGLPVAPARPAATSAMSAPSGATSITDATTRPVVPLLASEPPISPIMDAPTLPLAEPIATPTTSTPSTASMETQPIAPPAQAAITDDSATRPMTRAPALAAVPATAVIPPSASDPAGSARPRTLGIVGIVGIVVALLIIVALAVLAANGTLGFGMGSPSATPTPTATATPTPPPNFTAFTSSSYFTLQVPAGWNATQITPQDSHGREIRNFSNPTGDTLFVVLVNDSTLSPTATDESVLSFFAGKTAVQNRQGPDTATVAGENWARESADLTIAQIPGQSHAVVMTTNHGGLLYTIFFSAPSNSFEAASVGAFQPMLNSFAFVS